MSGFGRGSLRRLCEEQANPAPPPPDPSPLESVSLNAPMPDAVLAVWNGDAWVTWDRWLATAPIVCDEKPEGTGLAVPRGATCLAGECGGTKVWLVKDGDRLIIFAGSRKAHGRRRDFASPYVGHAIRTAEQWYGAAGGWREEKGHDERATEAADLYSQDSTVEKGTGERGHDDVDLDGT